MSIRITSEEHKVALFDSTTGEAFGPVFDSEQEAEEFVDFVNERTGKDPREIDKERLLTLKGVFDCVNDEVSS
jgi:hypothetical protein